MRGGYFSGNLERNLKSLDDNFVSFFKREAMLRREIIEKKNIEKGRRSSTRVGTREKKQRGHVFHNVQSVK